MTTKDTRPTPLTDEAWRGLCAMESVDSDDELAPLVGLRNLSRQLERTIAELAEYAQHKEDCLRNCAVYETVPGKGLVKITDCTCDLDKVLARAKGG